MEGKRPGKERGEYAEKLDRSERTYFREITLTEKQPTAHRGLHQRCAAGPQAVTAPR
jgi:hypothetical protein